MSLTSLLPISSLIAQPPPAVPVDATGLKLALVCMPWGSVARPSLAMGLLRQCARSIGCEVDLYFLNLVFASQIGLDTYNRIADDGFEFAEWFFSNSLFGPRGTNELDNSFAALCRNQAAAQLRECLLQQTNGSAELCHRIAETEVPQFIADSLQTIAWKQYHVVGFTTTFAQSLSSLLLAKEIKRLYPHLTIILGGANVEGDMGVQLLEGCPWIDYVVHGEAESSFPQLLGNLRNGRPHAHIPGVSLRIADRIQRGDLAPTTVTNLDTLPTPDYTDYFLALKENKLRHRIVPSIWYESSRGCWWGEKHHCTFCGLNGGSIGYRKKSPQRTYAEILELARKYQCLNLCAADNILPNEYFRDLLPQLSEAQLDLHLFYEVKANLNKSQLRQLAAAGVQVIQPGIESLNSKVLALMDKGTTAIQNIQLLKWCLEFNIEPQWNILYGFPGETPEDYADTPALIRLLTHLYPPNTANPIIFERFSPYHDNSERWNLALQPRTAYKFIYPESRIALDRIAYFFDGQWPEKPTGDQEAEHYTRATREAIEQWRHISATAEIHCEYEKGPGYLLIRDNRPALLTHGAKERRTTLQGAAATIYEICDANRSFTAIAKELRSLGYQLTDPQINTTLSQLCDQGFIFREGDRYLALALRRRVPLFRNKTNN
jgi:ribosomal peptide maturation radical SAM protein 1